MLPRLLLSATLALGAMPALAHAPAGHMAGDPVPAGCIRVNAYVPSGKIAHAPAPIRCGASYRATPQLAAQVQPSHPRAPLAAPRSAQD